MDLPEPLIVVGLDLSLTSTGVATIDDGRVHLRQLTSKGAADASLAERQARLRRLADEVVHSVHPAAALVVIEGPSLGQARQTGQHDRAGLWWLVVDLLLRDDFQVAEVSPAARAKYATGRGNASKDEVLAAVVRRYPMAEVDRNDVADAVVLAAMAAHHLGQPLATVPVAHAEALAKVRWPNAAQREEL